VGCVKTYHKALKSGCRAERLKLRSLALKGRQFETWQQGRAAAEKAIAYWNGHSTRSCGAAVAATDPSGHPTWPPSRAFDDWPDALLRNAAFTRRIRREFQ
jgi:hypothetical protein